MVKKTSFSLAILGMFGLLGFAVAQPVQNSDRADSTQFQQPAFNPGYTIQSGLETLSRPTLPLDK